MADKNLQELPEDGQIFKGDHQQTDRVERLPAPPPWRRFGREARSRKGQIYEASPKEIELVNAALYLRRPLLITGRPGVGKSSLAYAVAHELRLGEVLLWPINTRSTLQQGLYHYDALGRLQEASLAAQLLKKAPLAGNRTSGLSQIGRYVRLGPLGTALLQSSARQFPEPGMSVAKRPRVLLIDEIDKSDIDLPNDLLNVFEEGEYEIPELARLPDSKDTRVVEVGTYDRGTALIERGRVQCETFPIVFLTSNGEREFPPAFLRRCLRLDIDLPQKGTLQRIIHQHLALDPQSPISETLITAFLQERDDKGHILATDQLLNAAYIAVSGLDPLKRDSLRQALLRPLSESG
jgi:MoxR-like ATPase